MADPRKSVAIALEVGEFGKGYVNNASGTPVAPSQAGGIYYTLPPGTWISHSNEFKAQSIYTTGSKLRDTAAYGPFSGSWSIHFIMDYEHTEFLDLIFDDHQVSAAVSGVTTDMGASVYNHTWTKSNATFVKPFVIREKLLNRIANSVNEDALDEVILLKGCITRSVEFNRNQQGSQMEVRMSGQFADMEVQLAALSSTDYTDYNNTVGPTQYSCMFLDEESDEGYVRDVDSHSVKLDLDTSLVYNTCTPFATAYFEGQTHITWDAKTFANDPLKKFQLRPFSGGKDALHLKPMAKGLMPMAEAYFTTYNLSMRDTEGLDTFVDAISTSPYLLRFELKDSTVNAMSWPDGEGEKITDTLQGVETTKLILTVRNTHSTTGWANKINNNGQGTTYTPVPPGVTAKLRPTITSEDADLGYTTGSALSFTMKSGAFITISSADINRGKIVKSSVEDSAFKSTNGYNILDEGWITLPYSTALYSPPSGAPATLQELFDLTNEQVAALVNDDLTFTVNWKKKGIAITDGDTTTYESTLGYYPTTTITGTPSTPGTYKHYIIKCHLEDSGNTKILIVEDRGILRIDVTAAD